MVLTISETYCNILFIHRDKLRKIFPLSAFHMNGYGQTEISVMSAGPQEYEGLGEVYPGVKMKVILVQ